MRGEKTPRCVEGGKNKKLSISPWLLFAGHGLFSLPVWSRNKAEFIRSHEYKVMFVSLSKLLPKLRRVPWRSRSEVFNITAHPLNDFLIFPESW